MSPATAGEPVAAAGSGPVVTRIVITPVAMKDPPLLNASGVHEPYALRSIIELHTDSGIVGISEAYGDDPTLAQLGAAAAVLPGLDVFHLNELAGRRPRHPRGLLPRDQGPDSPAPRPPGGTSAASTS